MRGILVIIAFVLPSLPLHALDPRRPLNQFAIREWQDGLPQNSILAIRQTRDGYLWIGTYEGLTRFDGMRFVTFNRQNTAAFGVRGVFRLFEGSDGTLWVGTPGGGVVALEDGKFRAYSVPHGLSGTFVRGVDEDPSGGVWVATDGGLSIIRNGKVTPRTADPRLDRDIRAVARARDGSMWLATADGPLLRVRPDGAVEEFAAAAGIPPQMTVLATTTDGTVWIGAEGGVWRFAGAKATRLELPASVVNANVRAIYADREGTIWIGFEGGGMLRWYGGEVAHMGLKDGLSSDIVRSFWEDREGTLWIGTSGGGLNALRHDKIVTFAKEAGLRSNDVRCVLQDRAGTMWVGTAGGGVSRTAPDGGFITYGIEEGLPNAYVRTLASDSRGRVWIGMFGGGVARFDNGRFETFTTKDGLPSNNVNAILVTHAGDVWVHTDAGLVRHHAGKFTSALGSHIYSKRTIRSLYEDRKGDLWIGFVGELMRWRDGALERFSLGGDLSNQSIFTMLDDGAGNLWLGTDGGLVRFREGRFRAYRKTNGLFDETVFSIVEDAQRVLWMTSNRGLYRVAKKDLDDFDAGRISTIPSMSYGKSDGMRTDQCNGNSSPAAWKAADGRIWFATVRGVSVINPAEIPVNTLAPPVRIEEMIVDGRSLTAAHSMRIEGPHEKLEVHYTALSFMAPEKVLFRYKLEGFDDDWVDAGTRRTAYYTNLPPGSYRFSVIASNNDGVWNRTGASMGLILPTPLWKQWWAELLYVTLAATLIVAVVRMRVRGLRQRAAELELRVAERTAEIADNLRRLEISERRALESEQRALEASQAKSAFLANMSHELRTPLNAIMGYSEILVEEAAESHAQLVPDLQKIRTAGQHLLELIKSVLDLAKIEAGKMSLALEDTDVRRLVEEVAVTVTPLVERNTNAFEIDCAPDVGRITCDVVKMRQVLLNLLSNASKFTEHGRIRLEVAREQASDGGEISFVVTDTGIGMTADQMQKLFDPFTQVHGTSNRKYGGTGLGLALSRRFCQMMGGDISVESQTGIGTKFEVRLPVARAVSGRTSSPRLEQSERAVASPPLEPRHDDMPRVPASTAAYIPMDGVRNMPPQVRTDLLQALIRGDVAAASALIENMRPLDPRLALTLGGMMKEYRLDEMQSMLESE